MMKKEILSKPFVVLGTALKNNLLPDIFTAAYFKIVSLYVIMGVTILLVAGFVLYYRYTLIIQNVIVLIAELIQNRQPIDRGIAADLMTQSITEEVVKTNLVVGLWALLTIGIFAYILANITIRPIKRAVEKQKRFMGNVAHELRTPLSVMKTSTEIGLLDRENTSPAELIDILKSNLEEVDRMSEISSFLLEFSRLEHQRSAIALSPIDLSLVIPRAIKMVTLMADEKNVSILVFGIDTPVMIRGNAVAIEEMAVNLLKNAIAHTPAGGSVKIGAVKKSYGYVVMTVQDTGIGIPKEDLKNIFEPFYQHNDKTSARRKGSAGLGLAIVKEIAALHHASISVESEVGLGTTIAIKFSRIGPDFGLRKLIGR